MFGMQLLKEGKIVDYRQANAYQAEIEEMGDLTGKGWDKVIERYQVHNL